MPSVLLIEDERAQRTTIRDLLLAKQDFLVNAPESTQDLLFLLETPKDNHFDICLMDMCLCNQLGSWDDYSSSEDVRWLKDTIIKTWPNICFITITSFLAGTQNVPRTIINRLPGYFDIMIKDNADNVIVKTPNMTDVVNKLESIWSSFQKKEPNIVQTNNNTMYSGRLFLTRDKIIPYSYNPETHIMEFNDSIKPLKFEPKQAIILSFMFQNRGKAIFNYEIMEYYNKMTLRKQGDIALSKDKNPNKSTAIRQLQYINQRVRDHLATDKSCSLIEQTGGAGYYVLK